MLTLAIFMHFKIERTSSAIINIILMKLSSSTFRLAFHGVELSTKGDSHNGIFATSSNSL
jgi:hypothetical protein